MYNQLFLFIYDLPDGVANPVRQSWPQYSVNHRRQRFRTGLQTPSGNLGRNVPSITAGKGFGRGCKPRPAIRIQRREKFCQKSGQLGLATDWEAKSGIEQTRH